MDIDWSKAPEATHFDPEDRNFLKQFCGISMVWNTGKGWVSHHGQYPDDLTKLERLIIKPAAEPWTGEGLPPVGTVCTAVCLLGTFPASIKLFDGKDVVLRVEGPGGKLLALNIKTVGFKPIRTPEQIAAEEREKAVCTMAEELRNLQGPKHLHVLYGLYDLGYRKQVAP